MPSEVYKRKMWVFSAMMDIEFTPYTGLYGTPALADAVLANRKALSRFTKLETEYRRLPGFENFDDGETAMVIEDHLEEVVPGPGP